MGVWEVTAVGITMVFLIFVILYFLFILMEQITRWTTKEEGPKPSVVELEVERDEEIVAVISAALFQMLGKPVKIKKLRREREWVVWIKRGWRGVRKWSESSE